MKKIFLSLLLFIVGFYCCSATIKIEPIATKYTRTSDIIETNIVATKFVYAEIIYQKQYDIYKKWVNGNTVSQEVAKSIEDCKFLTDALDILGNDGWELVSTTLRNLNAGWEMTYTFKKRIN